MAFTLHRVAQWRHFPWRQAARTLAVRFREDKLALSAGSLTFTTILALVPFATVALAAFTAFPVFSKTQDLLQRWLMDSLIPETIALQVLDYITQFAAKASRLGTVGFSMLMVTAIMLILTIDRTLNDIWRVRKLRPLGQRILIYWAVITLGPLLLGLSLALTSYVASASRGLVQQLPGSLRLVFDSLEFFVLAAGMAGLYHYVPNTSVQWRHAWVGGLCVALCVELAKKALSLYLVQAPTYSVIYGTFATMPILLLWMYVVWVIVLLGAVVTAHLPGLHTSPHGERSGPGWTLELALQVLAHLQRARHTPHKGLRALELAQPLQADSVQLHSVLHTLCALDWIGALGAAGQGEEEPLPRYVLLVDLPTTALAPLLERLLLAHTPGLQTLWQQAQLERLCVAQVLPTVQPSPGGEQAL